ncbi:MAG: PAS domain-containing protein [Proteobacteria bacterium]|nr:PAS domain-containing protein [Pseudomonadota bacterium]
MGLWEVNIQTGKGNVDKRCAEMLGYQLDEIDSSMEFWNEIVHPEDKDRILKELEAYLSGKAESYSSEYRLLTKEGLWKWVLDKGKIIDWDEDGKPLILVGTHRDIQERKTAEESLIQEKNKLEAVIAALGDGLTVQDRNFKILYQNAIQKERQGEHVGDYCYTAYQGKNEVCDGCLVAKCFDDGQVHRRETSATTHEGKDIFMEVSASPVRDSQGKIFAAVETVRDITQRKALEAQLQQSQKLEAIGTLAGGIAHDFNNILAAIFGYAELVQSNLSKDSELWAFQEEVIKASHRAKELVKQILAFSRKENQELKPLQLSGIIQESLKMLRASIPTTIEIKEDINSQAGIILADPTQIHQVIMNLCTNAYHAMRETGGVLSIGLDKTDIDEMSRFKIPPGSYVWLTVSDTGHGMNKQIQERIFDPYYTTKQTGEGTGLGLAVVHGIITSYGGHIKVNSAPQKGTSFNVFLPWIDLPSYDQEDQTTDILPHGNERILVVDDEETIATLEERILNGLGYQVTSTTSSEKALQIFSSSPHEFDLIITDMTMPAINGAELSGKILALRPDIPILLCTGYSDLIDHEKASTLGISRLLMKPVARKELAGVVREILDK